MKEFAFIIPLYNDAQYISKCLQSLISAAHEVGCDHEIIVVDNYSTDGSFEIASSYPVTVVRVEGDRPSMVRNFGAQVANAKYYVFFDSDCVVNSRWLTLNCTRIKELDVGACGGPCVAPEDAHWVVTTWNPTELKPSYNEKGKLPGINFCIKADLFHELSGFDESLISAEDDALSKQVISAGYKCIADSTSANIHLGYPTTLIDIVNKQIWHGATQIRSHGLLGDKMTVATMAWLLSMLLLFVALLSQSGGGVRQTLSLLSGLMLITVPMLFLLNRLKSHKSVTLKKAVLGYLVAVHFISGRAIGLLKELISLLKLKN